MKRLCIALVVGCGMLMSFQALGAETIKIGYIIHIPHHYLSGAATKPRGATVAYMEAMAAKMGVEMEWVGPLPFIRLLDYLKDGTLDGFAHLMIRPEFKDLVYYGDKPFHVAQSIFVVRKENPLQQIASIQDVEGYRVGWLAGVAPSQFIQDNLAHLRMDYLTPSDTMWEQMLNKLLLDRFDAIYEMNAFTLPFVAKQLHIEDQIKVLLLPEPPQPLYVVFSKKSPKGKWLIEKFNAVQAKTPFSHEDYLKLIQQEFDALPKQ